MTDGCFYGNRGMFRVAPPLELKKLEAIFRHKVYETDPLVCPRCQGTMRISKGVQERLV